MFVHMNIATVPAFAPVHEYADWYRAFWSRDVGRDPAPAGPAAEVLAFHQEHYPEVRSFDDFIPQLTLEQWTPTRSRSSRSTPGCATWSRSPSTNDGFCWWDTDLTPRSSARQGPHRE